MELAVVAPMFFTIILGMVEFSRMVMVQQALTDAARDGSRTAALVTTTDIADVDAAVRSNLLATVTNANNTATCRVACNPTTLYGIESGTAITTTVEINCSDITWLPAVFLGNAVLQGKATMNRE